MITQNTQIVRNKEGRVVGRIENKIFAKDTWGSKHMLRKPIAWAIDCDIFDKIIKPLCLAIHITDKETGKTYVSGVKAFSENCHKINRKYGDQYYLELVHWSIR